MIISVDKINPNNINRLRAISASDNRYYDALVDKGVNRRGGYRGQDRGVTLYVIPPLWLDKIFKKWLLFF